MKLRTPFLRAAVPFGLGMLCCLLFVEAGLRFGAAVFTSAQEFRNRGALRDQGVYRIMCLGVSTTALGGDASYPAQLEVILNRRAGAVKFSVINKGVASTTISRILRNLEPDLDTYRPDMVVTMIGLDHMAWNEAASDSAALNFLRSLRVYKLIRFFGLHAANRFGKPVLDAPGKKSVREDEAALTRAIGLNPGNDLAYAQLGWLYRSQGRYPEAGALFRKALEIRPENDSAYDALKWFYPGEAERADARAEAELKKDAEVNPRGDHAYVVLGHVYQRQGRSPEAERLLRKAIELNPGNDSAYIELGYVCRAQGKLADAEASFKKALEADPKSDTACRILKEFYTETGNPKLADEYEKKLAQLSGYRADAARDYRAIGSILDQRGVVHVCVQHPMRSIEPLKRIFRGHEAGMIFVDNEKLFKDAVRADGYNEYFIDMAGGDFGHCTPRGNRLLAEHIADAILKKVYGE
jgi:tetratricopeptide (TPR) repeat protein